MSVLVSTCNIFSTETNRQPRITTFVAYIIHVYVHLIYVFIIRDTKTNTRVYECIYAHVYSQCMRYVSERSIRFQWKLSSRRCTPAQRIRIRIIFIDIPQARQFRMRLTLYYCYCTYERRGKGGRVESLKQRERETKDGSERDQQTRTVYGDRE